MKKNPNTCSKTACIHHPVGDGECIDDTLSKYLAVLKLFHRKPQSGCFAGSRQTCGPFHKSLYTTTSLSL